MQKKLGLNLKIAKLLSDPEILYNGAKQLIELGDNDEKSTQ